jgi:RHS repeat-associated protein
VNRLGRATETNVDGTSRYWLRGFQYDQYGNMWTSVNGGVPTWSMMPTSNVFNSANQITGESYDGAGNQTAIGPYTLQYDAENRLIQASQPASAGGGQVQYGYDAEGKRITKSFLSGPSTVYVYDVFGNLAAEYSSAPLTTAPACGTCYLSTDHLGSTRLVTGENGSVMARHDYLPFGEEIPSGYANRGADWAADDSVKQKFTAKERDTETGLDYFNARYMSSAQGRFTSPDPVFVTAHRVNDPQEWNLYAYSRNNPLRFTDPTGLDIWLQGCGDESDTCHKGYVGSYNEKGKFERTHLSGDLTDSASLGTTGISVNYNGSTYQGVWDTNKNEQNAVTVGGSGALSDLSFTVNGNCNNTCQASGLVNGTNTNSGLQSLQFAVSSPGSGFLKNPGFYGADPFHVGRVNFLGYDPNQSQGLAATHIPVPGSVLIDPKTGQPINVDFHVDQRYPFEDVTGFANHVGSIWHTLFNDGRSLFTGLVDHGGK